MRATTTRRGGRAGSEWSESDTLARVGLTPEDRGQGGGPMMAPGGVPPAPAGPTEGPPEAIPAQPPPSMPPARPAPAPGGTTATPLGAGTFAAPGTASAAPFRSLDFLNNRQVSGAGGPEDQVGQVPGGAPLGAAPTQNLDPEMIRRIFGSIMGG